MKETLEQKKQEVVSTVDLMKNSKTFVVFQYGGISVKDFQDLRKEMRKNGGSISVIRNNISSRAADEAGYVDVKDAFKGQVAVAFAKDDMIAPAKVIFKAAEPKDSKIKPIKGVVDGEVYSYDQLKTLATLPSYETLLTQLAAGMLGTLSQLAIGLNMLVEKDAENKPAEA
jgi:large subunit ribosomal protein L10